jgi:TonB family protein
VGLLVSLAVHGLVALQLVLPRAPTPEHEDPIDHFVVFLLPPRDEGGRQAGDAAEWSPLKGNEGAVEKAPPAVETPEVLPEGKAGEPEVPPPVPVGERLPVVEQALTEIEVDSVVERDPNSVAPVYPPQLLSKQVEGTTFVNYVVDTTGRVDTATIRVIRTTHVLFARSVRDALALMRFRPAIQASRKVRQWVEQNFAFKIVRPAAADTT